MKKSKTEIVTFKADELLIRAAKSVPNRSEFIRTAILPALANTCPVCRGTGILTPQQLIHWKQFAEDHSVRECHELYLDCSGRSGTMKHK